MPTSILFILALASGLQLVPEFCEFGHHQAVDGQKAGKRRKMESNRPVALVQYA